MLDFGFSDLMSQKFNAGVDTLLGGQVHGETEALKTFVKDLLTHHRVEPAIIKEFLEEAVAGGHYPMLQYATPDDIPPPVDELRRNWPTSDAPGDNVAIATIAPDAAESIAQALRSGTINGQGLIDASKQDPLRVFIAGYGGFEGDRNNQNNTIILNTEDELIDRDGLTKLIQTLVTQLVVNRI